MNNTPVTATPKRPLNYGEFVTMMAAAMALHAAAIDTMLPALPTIGRAFTVTSQNQLQWLVTIFMVGSGLGQIIYGPLTDRYGRRPV